MIGLIAAVMCGGAVLKDSLYEGSILKENRKRALQASKNNKDILVYKDYKGDLKLLSTNENARLSFGFFNSYSLIPDNNIYLWDSHGNCVENLTTLANNRITEYIKLEAKTLGLKGYPYYNCNNGGEYIYRFANRFSTFNIDFDNNKPYFFKKYYYPKGNKPDDLYATLFYCNNLDMFLHGKNYSWQEISDNSWEIEFTFKEKKIADKYDVEKVLTPEVLGKVKQMYFQITTQSW